MNEKMSLNYVNLSVVSRVISSVQTISRFMCLRVTAMMEMARRRGYVFKSCDS